MQAEAVLELVSEGNFVIIKGNGADANSDFLRQGMDEAGIPAAGESSDTITIVGETYTDNWDPALAQTKMEQFLTDNNNEVDAVLSENDGMAGGVVAALEAQGLAGRSRCPARTAIIAALNRVALGTQTVSVWKDARELGTAGRRGRSRPVRRTRTSAAVAGTADVRDAPAATPLPSSCSSPSRSPRTTCSVVARRRVDRRGRRCARASRPASVDGCP